MIEKTLFISHFLLKEVISINWKFILSQYKLFKMLINIVKLLFREVVQSKLPTNMEVSLYFLIPHEHCFAYEI